MHEIINPSVDTFLVSVGALNDTVHEVELPSGETMRTGQPIVVYKTDLAELRNLIFISHEEDTGEESVLYPIEFSTYLDFVALEAVKADINSFDFLKVSEFKHPNRDEWAIAVQQQCLMAMPEGDVKDRILASAEASIADGRRKTKTELLADGWV